ERIVEAQWVAEKRGHQRFRTEQPRYSIFSRTIEASVLPTAQRYGMGILSYGPLSSGWLSGRADPTQGARTARSPQAFDITLPANKAKLDAVDALTKLAAEAGLPMTHLATAFVRAHPAVTAVLIGPRTPSQLDDLLAGADVELTDDILDRIDEIVAPGTEINTADNMFATPPAITDKRLRRR
ncbi:MAG TPA: aldo/keto reductase, partial [Acidothermaceae bacterium]|nr:aldo/keto reductase [Acidothermaceae bacterium]